MVLVRGGKVLTHVQAFADACAKTAGANSFGTYNGHSPSIDRALDIFTPTNSTKLGDAICTFAIKEWHKYGLRYMIYRQTEPGRGIYWNGRGWRKMASRGDLTKDHFDHVHISFELFPGFDPSIPIPSSLLPRKDMQMFIFRHPGDTGTWITDGITKRPIGDPGTYIAAGVRDVGFVSDNFFNELPDAREVIYHKGK